MDAADRTASKRPRRSLRARLAAMALAGGALLVGQSCAADFDPPGKLNTMRVLSVDVDQSYPAPGDTVTFKMHYTDALDPSNQRPVQIVWLGGCFDPEGDQYFGCYSQLAQILASFANGQAPPPGTFAAGIGLDTFELPIPADIITRRPRPAAGPYAGTAFVFFIACAGTVKPIPMEGTSAAGSFPLGCFDADGKQLGPDSFVPGYTEVFSFEDGRMNADPVFTSLDLDGTPMPEDFAAAPHVVACDVTDEQRKQAGCAATDPFSACTTYPLKLTTPKDVAEVDPDAESADHQTLHETVWVSYFADGGDFDFDSKLVSDAQQGYTDTQEVTWVPPVDPGTYNIWAVLRDSRGGSSTIQRVVVVDPAK